MILGIVVYLSSLKTLCPEKEIRLLWHKLEANSPLLHPYINKYIPLKKITDFQDPAICIPSCYLWNNISLFIMYRNSLLFSKLCISLLAEIYQILKFKSIIYLFLRN